MIGRWSAQGRAGRLHNVCRSWNCYPGAQKRSITQNWLRKTQEAAEAWEAQAWDIRHGKKKAMFDLLEERGYINSVAGNNNELRELMIDKRVGAYVGIDPTAPSLHVGHLLPLMALFWMHVHGFHTVSLLGGSTAKIGDPTGRTTSRDQTASSVNKANMASMHYQLKRMWDNMEKHAGKYGYQYEWAWHRELVNNNAWWNKLSMFEVLKVLGTGVRVGTMLGKETVRNKMEKGDGMSFAEFTYPLLQAWDWWYMYQTKGIQLQIGGSDQYGNITAGIDAINYIRKSHYDPDIRQEEDNPLMRPAGFTTPLLTTASGEKFGKSVGNAVWLDKDMTSVFDLYQYFLRCADVDVARYLNFFTFIPTSEVERLVQEHEQQPSKRVAQRKLAREVVELIHGVKEADDVESEHGMLFGSSKNPEKPMSKAKPKPEPSDEASTQSPQHKSRGQPVYVPPAEINYSLNHHAEHTTPSNYPSPNITLPKSLVYNQPIPRLLYSAGLVASRSEGHRLAANRGAYIGALSRPDGTQMGDSLAFRPAVEWKDGAKADKFLLDDGQTLILRAGKWKIKVVRIIEDEEFEKRGLTAPGWKEEPRENYQPPL